jgi:hypothetical protein
MPQIEGIEFDAMSHRIISELIQRLKSDGWFAVYALKERDRGKGEIRFAHHGPDIKHTKGRGVFARIQPNVTGATHIPRKRYSIWLGIEYLVGISFNKSTPGNARCIRTRHQENGSSSSPLPLHTHQLHISPSS